ncbi:MAG: RNase P subunit p30 family protein [Promethearchaeota archaeon]
MAKLTMYINSSIPWLSDSNKFSKLVHLCYRVGYQAAIVDLQSEQEYKQFTQSDFYPQEKVSVSFPLSIKTIGDYKEPISKFSPIPLLPRITLKPKNEEALKKDLSSWSQRSCLIAVQSTKKEILEVAARDGRVDLLSIPTDEHQSALTKGIISLAKQNQVFLDISITPFIILEYYKRSKAFRVLHRLFSSAKPLSHFYSLGSSSEIRNKSWLIRGPKETLAILHAILDVPEVFAKQMIGDNCEKLVMRFIKRDQELFIEPGVEIVDKVSKNDEKGEINKADKADKIIKEGSH